MSVSVARGYREIYLGAFYSWRDLSPAIVKLVLALGFAALTGLCAQIAVPLPFTPVPVTGQTFAVLLAGVLLGSRWGAVSQILYVAIGASGVPWFAGAAGGVAPLFGPTGGYLAGFVLAALFLGNLADGASRRRDFFGLVGLLWFSSFALIQIPGLCGLYAWHVAVLGKTLSLNELLAMGFLPFVPGDAVKILSAAAAARALTPRRA